VEKAEEREANTERARSADTARAHRLAAAIHSEVERDQQGISPIDESSRAPSYGLIRSSSTCSTEEDRAEKNSRVQQLEHVPLHSSKPRPLPKQSQPQGSSNAGTGDQTNKVRLDSRLIYSDLTLFALTYVIISLCNAAGTLILSTSLTSAEHDVPPPSNGGAHASYRSHQAHHAHSGRRKLGGII